MRVDFSQVTLLCFPKLYHPREIQESKEGREPKMDRLHVLAQYNTTRQRLSLTHINSLPQARRRPPSRTRPIRPARKCAQTAASPSHPCPPWERSRESDREVQIHRRRLLPLAITDWKPRRIIRFHNLEPDVLVLAARPLRWVCWWMPLACRGRHPCSPRAFRESWMWLTWC